MTITVYGAYRSNTTMTDNTATYATIGASFQINSYSSLTFNDGADGTVIDGDSVVNESPNDPTQTLAGNAILWDYTIQVTDGFNIYQIGVMDYDINGDGSNQYPGAEQGYFLTFIGSVPPLNTTLTIGGITNNGASIPVSSVVPCFVAGTMIDTPGGARAIETLAVGDLVTTADNGAQPIRWVGRNTLDLRDLVAKPKLQPIRITAGALGNGMPKRDLCVSPQHRILVSSAIARRIFNVDEVLVPANKLLAMPGVFVDMVEGPVAYFHLLFDSHEIVFAEGAPSESLFTGQEALKSVGQEALEEIQALFPEVSLPQYQPVAARHIPDKGKQVKTLVRRHVENAKPMVAGL